MGRKKNSNAGSGVAIILIGAAALLAAIPKEAWIGVAVLTGMGIVVYLYSKPKSSAPSSVEDEVPTAALRSIASESASARRASTSPLARASAPVEHVSTAARRGEDLRLRLPVAHKCVGASSWIPLGRSIDVGGCNSML